MPEPWIPARRPGPATQAAARPLYSSKPTPPGFYVGSERWQPGAPLYLQHRLPGKTSPQAWRTYQHPAPRPATVQHALFRTVTSQPSTVGPRGTDPMQRRHHYPFGVDGRPVRGRCWDTQGTTLPTFHHARTQPACPYHSWPFYATPLGLRPHWHPTPPPHRRRAGRAALLPQFACPP